MSEKQILIMKTLQHRLEEIKAKWLAYKFAVYHDKETKDLAVKDRKAIYLELEVVRHKSGNPELRQISVQSFERIIAQIDDAKPQLILVDYFRIAGEAEALEYAIEHFGNLEEIEAHLIYKTESLYMAKERMGEFASPRLFLKAYIKTLLEAKELIQQITKNE